MLDTIPDLNFNLSISDGFEDDNEAFKFDLFLMTREIKQITNSLKQVTLLPKKQQHDWVKNNQKLLHKFMNSLTHDMSDVLDEMSLDRDVLQKTIACVTELRELVNTLNGLMTGGLRLRS
jgi:K+-sensing histidine kinase KdpD